jgi:hypothetical protein
MTKPIAENIALLFAIWFVILVYLRSRMSENQGYTILVYRKTVAIYSRIVNGIRWK